ncbi:MAG TPA: trypsin-like peptidase domain-containing protein [Anaerolineales bacterium]|nr:trypsin-like peptidase domain-containing protein [Anaerolineales bacterium]
MGMLSDLSQALAGAVEAAGGGVVRVDGRRRIPASGIVWSADGMVITAHHVVESDEEIRVGLPDGEMVPAELVGRDHTTDLALLRTEARDLSVPRWMETDELKVGHLVLALGRPGSSVLATMGIVSALDGAWRTPAGGMLDQYLQTDVVMYPGFSGGPLVDVEGRMIGLNTSGLLRGVSLTIGVKSLREVAEMLLTHGRVRRGYLGVGAQPVRLPAGAPSEVGLLLVSVESESPAEKGGLILGDVITGIEDDPVQTLDDLMAGLSGDRIGQPIRLTVLRGGVVTQISLIPGERPEWRPRWKRGSRN